PQGHRNPHHCCNIPQSRCPLNKSGRLFPSSVVGPTLLSEGAEGIPIAIRHVINRERQDGERFSQLQGALAHSASTVDVLPVWECKSACCLKRGRFPLEKW